MRDVQISPNTTLRLYESIKELPIRNSKRLAAHLVQDAGIGSDMEAVDSHLGRITYFLANDKKAEAIEEAKNLRYNLFVMLSGMNYKALSLMCLVHSINGEPVTDYSDAALQRMADMIGDAPTGEVERVLDEIKKNLIPNAETISRGFLGMA